MIISQFLTSLACGKYKRILTLKRDQKINYHCFKDINCFKERIRKNLTSSSYITRPKRLIYLKARGAHQPTAWPVPTACAQPYHPRSGSHGQLFRPYWSSSAWHSRRVCLIYIDNFERISEWAVINETGLYAGSWNCFMSGFRRRLNSPSGTLLDQISFNVFLTR